MLKEKILKICDLSIEFGILAIIFFIPVIFDFSMSSYNFFDLYKAIVFRAVLSLIFLAFAAKVFINGELRFRGSAKIFLFAGFLAACFLASSFFSIDPSRSFWGSFSRQQGFYNFSHYILFFILAVLNIKNDRQIKRIAIAVLASSFFVSAYGLAQYFLLDPWAWPENFLSSGRVFSTFGQPNFLAHWLIMVVPLSIYYLIFIAKKFFARFLACLIIFMQSACLVLAYSRAAWLGFLCSALFLIIFWLFYKGFKKTVFGFAGIVFICAALVIGLNMAKPAEKADYDSINFAGRLKSIVDFKSGSNKMRIYYLESAVKEIKKASGLRLFLGYGPEVLSDVFMKYYNIDWGVYEAINSLHDRAHNWIFDQLLSFGILGLAANLLFYVYIFYKTAVFLSGKRAFEANDWLVVFLSASLLAYCVNNLFSFSLAANSVYLYLIAALLWVSANRREQMRILGVSLTAFSKIFIWTALFFTSAMFVYSNNINQARAENYYVKALESLRRSDCEAVAANMEKAMSLSSNSSYYQENNILLNLNCFFLVESDSEKSFLLGNIFDGVEIAKDGKTYGILSNIARAYSLFGFYIDKAYYAESEKIFNDLISKFPYFTSVYEDLARQKMASQDYAGAAKILSQAIGILPPTDHPYLNSQHRSQISAIAAKLHESLGLADFKMENYEAALDNYKKGLKFDPYRASLYKNISDVYYARNNLDKAIEFSRRGFMLNPSDYHWPLSLSFLYKDKKDFEAEKKYFDQAVKMAPENAKLKN
ncbi:MAG: O-antigen ligase family protein [bacterium]